MTGSEMGVVKDKHRKKNKMHQFQFGKMAPTMTTAQLGKCSAKLFHSSSERSTADVATNKTEGCMVLSAYLIEGREKSERSEMDGLCGRRFAENESPPPPPVVQFCFRGSESREKTHAWETVVTDEY